MNSAAVANRPLLVAAPLALAAILHISLAAASWHHGPGMNSDSAAGFLIWDAWQSGLPWNHQPTPDPGDITRDSSLFQAWWSPGQYLAVAPLQLLGLNLGQAIAVGSLLWTLGGLAGWHRLFLRFDFSPGVAAWSTALLACNWTLVRNYGDYMGGELALLGAAPWLMLGLWQNAKPASNHLSLMIPPLIWLGAMAKNTFLPVAGGVLLARRWPVIADASFTRRLMELAGIGVALALGHALFWLTFLRHGWHPGSGGLAGPSGDALLNLVRLLSFPLGGLASLQNLLGRIFFHPSDPLAPGWEELWPLLTALGLGLAVLTFWLVRRELRLRPAYGRLLAAVTGGSAAFFALVAITRDAGGLEERFLRPCSFLFAPAALAALVTAGPRLGRCALALLLGLGAAYGAASGPMRALHLWRLDARGVTGVCQSSLGPEGLAELHRLDRTLPSGSLVVVSSPEIAFEVTRSRRWATHLEMTSIEHVAPTPLRGRPAAIVVVAGPGARAHDRHHALLARFADWPADGWQETRIGDWSFYRQGATLPRP